MENTSENQMVARQSGCLDMVEVTGSTPVGSTTPPEPALSAVPQSAPLPRFPENGNDSPKISSIRQKRRERGVNGLPPDVLDFRTPWRPHCIYFLILRDEIVYVGQSNDLPGRLADHRRQARIEFTRVKYLPCRRRDAHRIESLWIRKLEPRFNRVGFGGGRNRSGIEVMLIEELIAKGVDPVDARRRVEQLNRGTKQTVTVPLPPPEVTQ